MYNTFGRFRRWVFQESRNCRHDMKPQWAVTNSDTSIWRSHSSPRTSWNFETRWNWRHGRDFRSSFRIARALTCHPWLRYPNSKQSDTAIATTNLPAIQILSLSSHINAEAARHSHNSNAHSLSPHTATPKPLAIATTPALIPMQQLQLHTDTILRGGWALCRILDPVGCLLEWLVGFKHALCWVYP